MGGAPARACLIAGRGEKRGMAFEGEDMGGSLGFLVKAIFKGPEKRR